MLNYGGFDATANLITDGTLKEQSIKLNFKKYFSLYVVCMWMVVGKELLLQHNLMLLNWNCIHYILLPTSERSYACAVQHTNRFRSKRIFFFFLMYRNTRCERWALNIQHTENTYTTNFQQNKLTNLNFIKREMIIIIIIIIRYSV